MDTTIVVGMPLHTEDRDNLSARFGGRVPMIYPNSTVHPCTGCQVDLAFGPNTGAFIAEGVAKPYCPACAILFAMSLKPVNDVVLDVLPVVRCKQGHFHHSIVAAAACDRCPD